MKISQFLNDAFHQYGQNRGSLREWKDIDDFLYNEDRCLKLLLHYLDLGYSPSDQWLRNNLYRCQHIFVTFLMGLGLIQKFNLLKGVNTINNMPDEYLWMLTSVVHDYGYLKNGLTEMPELSGVDEKYNLLSDGFTFNQLSSTADYSENYPQFMTYSYDTIKKYYAYKSNRLAEARVSGRYNKDGETVDHGIYGACQCYKEYCDFYIKHEYPRSCIAPEDKREDVAALGYDHYRINERPEIVKLARTEPVLYKTACLIAAQHNMFRSSNTDSDKIYSQYGLDSLLSTTPVAVTRDNPLLYLLSIVDTIECTKGFEKMSIPDSTKSFNLSIKTVLENVLIELNDDSIIVDYSPLRDVIKEYWCFCHRNAKKKIMLNQLEKQLNNSIELMSWVDCASEPMIVSNRPYAVKIKVM